MYKLLIKLKNLQKFLKQFESLLQAKQEFT